MIASGFMALVGLLLSTHTFAGNSSQPPPAETSPSFLSRFDQVTMIASPTTKALQHNTYLLSATPATTQWGVLDNTHKLILRMRSGDTVNFIEGN